MNVAEFVRDYGYYAVALGTFFEGELIMLVAGMAAAAGVLWLPGVILAGMSGIFASDTFCFFLGRFAGARLKNWFPRLYARLDRVFVLIERHDQKLVVFFQFFPGICTATPVAFGMSKISSGRFMLLDLVGNATWTILFSAGGYLFGATFEHWVRTAHDWEWIALGLVAVCAVVGWRLLRTMRSNFVPED